MSDRRPPEQPRFALVVWPNNQLGCIPLDHVTRALGQGAFLIASEADFLPFNPPRVVAPESRD